MPQHTTKHTSQHSSPQQPPLPPPKPQTNINDRLNHIGPPNTGTQNTNTSRASPVVPPSAPTAWSAGAPPRGSPALTGIVAATATNVVVQPPPHYHGGGATEQSSTAHLPPAGGVMATPVPVVHGQPHPAYSNTAGGGGMVYPVVAASPNINHAVTGQHRPTGSPVPPTVSSPAPQGSTAANRKQQGTLNTGAGVNATFSSASSADPSAQVQGPQTTASPPWHQQSQQCTADDTTGTDSTNNNPSYTNTNVAGSGYRGKQQHLNVYNNFAPPAPLSCGASSGQGSPVPFAVPASPPTTTVRHDAATTSGVVPGYTSSPAFIPSTHINTQHPPPNTAIHHIGIGPPRNMTPHPSTELHHTPPMSPGWVTAPVYASGQPVLGGLPVDGAAPGEPSLLFYPPQVGPPPHIRAPPQHAPHLHPAMHGGPMYVQGALLHGYDQRGIIQTSVPSSPDTFVQTPGGRYAIKRGSHMGLEGGAMMNSAPPMHNAVAPTASPSNDPCIFENELSTGIYTAGTDMRNNGASAGVSSNGRTGQHKQHNNSAANDMAPSGSRQQGPVHPSHLGNPNNSIKMLDASPAQQNTAADNRSTIDSSGSAVSSPEEPQQQNANTVAQSTAVQTRQQHWQGPKPNLFDRTSNSISSTSRKSAAPPIQTEPTYNTTAPHNDGNRHIYGTGGGYPHDTQDVGAVGRSVASKNGIGDEIPAITIGSEVKLRFASGVAMAGEVFCIDFHDLKTIVLKEDLGDDTAKLRIVNLQAVVELVVMPAKLNVPAVQLPAHNKTVLEKREREALELFESERHQYGIGVTKEAQEIFDFIHNTHPGCRWGEGAKAGTIIVMSVHISPPYETGVGVDERATERINKVLRRFRERRNMKEAAKAHRAAMPWNSLSSALTHLPPPMLLIPQHTSPLHNAATTHPVNSGGLHHNQIVQQSQPGANSTAVNNRQQTIAGSNSPAVPGELFNARNMSPSQMSQSGVGEMSHSLNGHSAVLNGRDNFQGSTVFAATMHGADKSVNNTPATSANDGSSGTVSLHTPQPSAAGSMTAKRNGTAIGGGTYNTHSTMDSAEARPSHSGGHGMTRSPGQSSGGTISDVPPQAQLQKNRVASMSGGMIADSSTPQQTTSWMIPSQSGGSNSLQQPLLNGAPGGKTGTQWSIVQQQGQYSSGNRSTTVDGQPNITGRSAAAGTSPPPPMQSDSTSPSSPVVGDSSSSSSAAIDNSGVDNVGHHQPPQHQQRSSDNWRSTAHTGGGTTSGTTFAGAVTSGNANRVGNFAGKVGEQQSMQPTGQSQHVQQPQTGSGRGRQFVAVGGLQQSSSMSSGGSGRGGGSRGGGSNSTNATSAGLPPQQGGASAVPQDTPGSKGCTGGMGQQTTGVNNSVSNGTTGGNNKWASGSPVRGGVVNDEGSPYNTPVAGWSGGMASPTSGRMSHMNNSTITNRANYSGGHNVSGTPGGGGDGGGSKGGGRVNSGGSGGTTQRKKGRRSNAGHGGNQGVGNIARNNSANSTAVNATMGGAAVDSVSSSGINVARSTGGE